jgi:hypothetical protein
MQRGEKPVGKRKEKKRTKPTKKTHAGRDEAVKFSKST